MKKCILILLAVVFAGTFVIAEASAADKPAAAPAAAPAVQADDSAWDFFELVFFPGVPSYSDDSNVYGIKAGAPVSGGKGVVNGVEGSVFASLTERVNGVQASGLYNDAKEVNGLQFSLVNFASEKGWLQLGGVNVSQGKGFQIGIVNYIKDAWIPFLPIINFKF